MKRFLAAFSFAILALTATAQQKPAAVDDSQFSLNKGSVFEAATPTTFEFEDGAKTLRPLEGSGMPVMISHTIDDDLPITLEKNGCIRCHTTTGKKVRGAPAVPVSHIAVPAGDKPALAGKRWNCTACHAPQADVKPLVANTGQ
jgi:nitrate reductase (cytochrome), electron transfer subunit